MVVMVVVVVVVLIVVCSIDIGRVRFSKLGCRVNHDWGVATKSHLLLLIKAAATAAAAMFLFSAPFWRRGGCSLIRQAKVLNNRV